MMKKFLLIAVAMLVSAKGYSGGSTGGSGSPALQLEAAEFAKQYLNSQALINGDDLPRELVPSTVDGRIGSLNLQSLKRLSTEYGNAFVATHRMLNATSDKEFSEAEGEKASAEEHIESILSDE